jgi:sialic acid synthase SpsE
MGLSDHTIDNTTAIASVALGASIIEKHVTLDRNGGGPDDSFSLEEEELKELCVGIKAAWQSLGKVDYAIKSSEQGNVKFHRSIYVIKDIKKGEQFTKENIRSIRPGFGLKPKYYDQILGKIAKCDIKLGTPTSFDMIL